MCEECSLPIPTGKTVRISSKADGARLAARNGVLVNLDSSSPGIEGDARTFTIVGLGCGQIALQATDGGYVTADAFGGPGDLRIKLAPIGARQSFFWQDYRNGDVALLSLATHRYVRSMPSDPGLVSADHAGPAPSGIDGSIFVITNTAD